MMTQQLFLVLVLLAPFTIGYLLPRVSAYFLGPAILVATAVLSVVFHNLFVPFQSDGSLAGLMVPAMTWAAAIVGCISGIVLIVTGILRKPREGLPIRQPLAADRVRRPGFLAALSLFNVALGTAVLIEPFAPPIGLVFPRATDALLRSVNLFSYEMILFLCRYFVSALLLYVGFRIVCANRKLTFNTSISILILVGNMVVLLFPLANVVRLLDGPAPAIFLLLGPMRALSWLGWAGILIGLFLFWRAQAGSSERIVSPT